VGQSAHSLRPRLPVAVAVLVAAMFSAGPAALADSPSPAAAGGAPAQGVLRIGYTQEGSETGINPFLQLQGTDFEVLTANYDLLVEFGPKAYEPVPGIADAWQSSTDGLTWTYHIRSGASWQDGQPITADDVAFTYQYILSSHDAAYRGAWAPAGNDVAGGGDNGDQPDGEADNPLTYFDSYLDLDAGFDATRVLSVQASDPQTVVIRLKAPLGTLLQLYIPIVPKHIWNAITFADAANKALFDVTKSVGSGPFQVVEYKPKEIIRLKAFSGYWGGAPKIGEIRYQFYGSVDAAIQALKSGEIDLIDEVPFSQFSGLTGDASIATLTAKSSDFAELGFQSWNPTKAQFQSQGCADRKTCKIGPTTGSNANPWLTKPEVRRALETLVDKRELVDKGLQGYGDPGAGLVNPALNTFGYAPPADDPLVYPTYDPNDDAAKAAIRTQRSAAARASLEALGFADTDGNGILNVPSDAASKAFDPRGAGKDFKLRLFVRDTRPHEQLAADLLKQWFEAAGVAIDKQVVKEDFLTSATYPSDSNADSDLYLWGWGPDPDPNFILGVLTTDNINNWQDANWSDAEYDRLVREQRGATDPAARKDLITQALKRAYDQGPYDVIWYLNTLQAYRKDLVQGLRQFPDGAGPWWTALGFGPYGSLLSVEPYSPAPAATPAAPAVSEGGSPAPQASIAPATPAGSTGGGNTALIVGAVALIVVLAGGVLLLRRRAAGEDDD
jgi:peptide/nickel transport system substrate-binding protein